jgi:hypothetical protein
MDTKCANRFCSSRRVLEEGKLYRIDLDIADLAGPGKYETFFVWLCDDCALAMVPRLEIAQHCVQVRLGPIVQNGTAVKSFHRPPMK